MHTVLWSPVGAPAGVPGPRRNADECDAGWFAPVATRRRPIFVGLWPTSLWLAVFPGGIPPGAPCRPLPAPGSWGACHLRCLEGGHLWWHVVGGWLPAVAARRHRLRGGGPPRRAEPGNRVRGQPGMAGRQARSLGEPLFPGEHCPLRWVIQNPGVTTRSGHFRSPKHGVFGLAELAR